jgi:hypothetical protein
MFLYFILCKKSKRCFSLPFAGKGSKAGVITAYEPGPSPLFPLPQVGEGDVLFASMRGAALLPAHADDSVTSMLYYTLNQTQKESVVELCNYFISMRLKARAKWQV